MQQQTLPDDHNAPHTPTPALVDPWDALDDHLTDHDGLCDPGCPAYAGLWIGVIRHLRKGL